MRITFFWIYIVSNNGTVVKINCVDRLCFFFQSYLVIFYFLSSIDIDKLCFFFVADQNHNKQVVGYYNLENDEYQISNLFINSQPPRCLKKKL